ncbi:MAG TPA: homocysteine S-methyltransferase [Gemmatimonadaceae bacterium]|nr:homocysteine S-methyltransferase [Gemmatimonadaceae bacterium]
MTKATNITERLRDSRAILLDGGLATELERRGLNISGALWSARVLVDAPDAIEQLHYDYFRAGAECATSASYQASFDGFAGIGIGRAEAARLFRRSVELAATARARWVTDVGNSAAPRFVAASVGPFGATRHDGSEYHGNYGLSVAQLRQFHAERLGVLVGAGADVLACETIPSLDEARAVADLLRDHSDSPAWVSFTSPDGVHTAHGEPLAECGRFLDRVPNVVAIGVNCLHPSLVSRAIAEIKTGTAKPIVVYPNSGEQWDARAREWRGAVAGARLADLAPSWVEAGARMVGGCCRTGPDDIAAIARVLRQSGSPAGRVSNAAP